MPNYTGSSVGDGINFTAPTSNTNALSFDWLNASLNNLATTATNVADLKSKFDMAKQQSDQKQQKDYQDSSQAMGSKNLVSGVDNNFVLLGIGALLVGFMIVRG